MKPTALLPLLPVAALLTLGVAGCGDDSRYDYGRPPIDQVSNKDRGLQSKDVVTASEQMAQDLFSNPQLNADGEAWLLVVGNFTNLTTTARGDLDIFLQRLENRLFDMSEGRIQLVENRDRLRELRNSELDGGELDGDPYGQGFGGARPGDAPRIQPRYILSGQARDLPNRSTNYYNLEFVITDFRTGLKVWSDMYEVRVKR